MNFVPEPDKTKRKKSSVIREQITSGESSCLRGVFVFIGLLLLFGVILFVMAQL